MALQNVLPLPVNPGFRWSSVTPNATQEIITTYDMEEADALTQPADADIAWAERGSHVSVGSGIVKIIHRLPQSMAFQQFKYGGTRTYNSVDVTASEVHVNPWDLSYAWPMIFDTIGNGYKLMNAGSGGDLTDFAGIGGLAGEIVTAGRAYKAQLVASLFYTGYTSAALSMTASSLTYPQPGLPSGNPLFTDGVGSPLHYSHPMNANSGRFQNAYPAFGTFAQRFGSSLVKMTQKPHATLPNMTSGARVTDVIGPTWMRDRFWQMAVANLQLQSTGSGGNIAAAAASNVYTTEVLKRFNEDSFIGAAGFGPQTYWLCPQLDNHPYFTANSSANMTTGPDGGPADMWINISAGPKRPTWAKLASNSRDFTPIARYYGEGDPRAMSERRVRLETDLDAGVAVGAPGEIDLFFGV